MILFCIVCHSVGTLAIEKDSILCDTGIKISQDVIVEESANALVIYNEPLKKIFVIAIDTNRDGLYEILVFDTNGDGQMDMQLEGGQATAEEVLWLYCGYQVLPMI